MNLQPLRDAVQNNAALLSLVNELDGLTQQSQDVDVTALVDDLWNSALQWKIDKDDMAAKVIAFVNG